MAQCVSMARGSYRLDPTPPTNTNTHQTYLQHATSNLFISRMSSPSRTPLPSQNKLPKLIANDRKVCKRNDACLRR